MEKNKLNEEVFNNNINLAYSFAQKYKDKFYNIEYDDLQQLCLFRIIQSM